MPASQGTPTILQKIAAKLGFGAAIGMTPAEISSTVAGDNADLTKAEQDVLSVLQPFLASAETQGLADLTNFLKAVLANLPTITSLGNAVDIVMAALKAESGPLLQQAETLGQSAFGALVGAALAAVGKTGIPA